MSDCQEHLTPTPPSSSTTTTSITSTSAPCPGRLSKAESVLRNRTDRVSVLVEGLDQSPDVQAIVRTSESLGINDIYSLTRSNIKTSSMVHNITKGSHAFVTITNTDINSVVTTHCGEGGELWYVAPTPAVSITRFTSNTHLYSVLLQEKLYSTRRRDLIFLEQCSETASEEERQNAFTSGNHRFTKTTPLALLQRLSNPNIGSETHISGTDSTTKAAMLQAFNNETMDQGCDPDFYHTVLVLRIPLPLHMSVYGHNNAIGSQYNTASNKVTQDGVESYFWDEQQEVVSTALLTDYHHYTIQQTLSQQKRLVSTSSPLPPIPGLWIPSHTTQLLDEWIKAKRQQFFASLSAPPSPSFTIPGYIKGPLLPFPQRVIIGLDTGFTCEDMALLAHRHVYLPTAAQPLHVTPSIQATIYLDCLLTLCPEAIGNISIERQAKIRMDWIKKLAKNKKNLVLFEQWAKRWQEIPLLTTLRMDAILKGRNGSRKLGVFMKE